MSCGHGYWNNWWPLPESDWPGTAGGQRWKESWPELVGSNGEYAKMIIERQNCRVHAIVLLEGSPATLDLRYDRVRVFVNQQGLVVRVPTVG